MATQNQNSDVSIVELPTDNRPVTIMNPPADNTSVTVMENPDVQKEVSIINPADANQNIQGPKEQAKVQPASPSTTNLPSQQETIKTNKADVENTFLRLLGRKPTSQEDMANVEYLTKLSPEDVEASLQETRNQIIGSQKQTAPAQTTTGEKATTTTVTGEPAKTAANIEGDWQVFADGSKFNSKTGEVIGKDGTSSTQKTTEDTANKEKTIAEQLADNAEQSQAIIDKYISDLDAFGATMSEASKSQIESIKASYAIRKAQQMSINKALLGGTAVSGMVSGRARYARDIQQSILSAEESAGVSRLSALDAEEKSLIAEAQMAMNDKQFALLEKKKDALLKVQDAKKEALLETARIAKEQEEAMMNKLKAIQDQDNADRTYNLEVEKYLSGEQRAEDKAKLDRAQLDVTIAGLTGEYQDAPTLEAKKLAADQAFRTLGYELNKAEFDEMVKNNSFNQKISERKVKLEESKQAAEMSGEDVSSLANDIMSDISDYKDVVKNLKNPASKQALDYNIARRREAFKDEYNETQNDYYRFKSSMGKTGTLTETARTKLEKVFTVASQMQDIEQSFNDVAFQKKVGVIAGKLSKLNPWDKGAVILRNQMAGAISLVARGIFGEVGVLTDTDIANYTKAVIAQDQPEEAGRKTLQGLYKRTLEMAQNELKVAEGGGVDVSGYAKDYDNLARQINPKIGVKQLYSDKAYLYDTIGDYKKSIPPEKWTSFESKMLDEMEQYKITDEETYFKGLRELEFEARDVKQPTFNKVGSDTNKAVISKLSTKEDGANGGQCGRFVNSLTGLGVGDSYQSKMSKMDPTITRPEPGMVYTMPTNTPYGHIGFIVGIDGDQAIVKDSNYGLDEKIRTHKIALSKITGLARV